MLGNLLIDFPLGFPRRNLLLFSVLVGDSNLFVHHLDHSALGGLLLGIFALGFLDVGEQLGLFQLSLIFLLLANLLPLGDLVNEHLLPALSSLSCPLLSCHLILNCFKTLDFHHHIESLLLLDPVLLEDAVLFQLLITHRHNLRLQHELVHSLDVIVALINCGLNIGHKWIVIVCLHFDLKWSVSLPLSIL